MQRTIQGLEVLNDQAFSLVETYGNTSTHLGILGRGRMQDQHVTTTRLSHLERGRRQAPIDLTSSLAAIASQGFELESLPMQPTELSFEGKIETDGHELDGGWWQLISYDERFGVTMCINDDGSPERIVNNRRTEGSVIESGKIIHPRYLGFAAVLLDHVAQSLAR